MPLKLVSGGQTGADKPDGDPPGRWACRLAVECLGVMRLRPNPRPEFPGTLEWLPLREETANGRRPTPAPQTL